jgi:hypothetical protein
MSHVPAGSPSWVYGVVTAGLLAHIAGGTGGIVFGYAAATVKKGERLHRLFGTLFLASMTLMATMALTLALFFGQKENIMGGIFALYLVATGWMAVRRGEGRVGAFDYGAFAVAAGLAMLLLSWGFEARVAAKPDASPILYFVFASLASLAAGFDLKTILKGGVKGAQRIARHLSRMCFAFFFATGSFFFGQQKVMPPSVHGSPVLALLALAPLGIMLFWLIRVRFVSAQPKPALAS